MQMACLEVVSVLSPRVVCRSATEEHLSLGSRSCACVFLLSYKSGCMRAVSGCLQTRDQLSLPRLRDVLSPDTRSPKQERVFVA